MRTRSAPAEEGGGPPAVIVGLDCITGLQTARVLAARGVHVIGLAERRRHFCCRTNTVQRVVRSPLAGEPLVRSLLRLAGELDRRAVLVPCTDQSVVSISAARDRLQDGFLIRLPDHETVEMLVDKERFGRYAESRGLPVPRMRRVTSDAELGRVAEELRFPVVLKPRLKTQEWLRRARAKALKLGSADELTAAHRRLAGLADGLLVQEWIEGGEENLYSCNCYFDATSTPIVTFVARKLRQWPPETGTSSLGEECRNDRVLAATLELFRGVGYRGLGYVEMKRDARSGEHFFVEPNVGRPTGRSTIAEAGGVELHYAAYCETAGLPLPAALTQRYGDAKWIYLRHDLQAAAHAWRRGHLSVGQWWRSVDGVRSDAVFRLADPLPFAADIVGVLGSLTRKRGRADGS